jgi:hypothetical protein
VLVIIITYNCTKSNDNILCDTDINTDVDTESDVDVLEDTITDINTDLSICIDDDDTDSGISDSKLNITCNVLNTDSNTEYNQEVSDLSLCLSNNIQSEKNIVVECNIPDEFRGTGKVNKKSKIYKEAYSIWTTNKSQKFRQTIPEIICYLHMLNVYHIDMEKNVRPNILRNPETGRNLEYDLYDPIRKWAIEYNGVTHSEWPNHTNQTKEEFKKQLRRDDLKLRLSDLHGVYLISVPHIVDYDMIPKFLDYYLRPLFTNVI